MNNRIKELQDQVTGCNADRAKIEEKLQAEWDKVFNDSTSLRKAITNAESASEYQTGKYGEIESWYRYADLSDYSDCREYFESWLLNNHCMRVEWDSDCPIVSHGGEDNYHIQDDTRHDNGVWQSGKCVIKESEYKEDDGEVNEAWRNELIEKRMEREGYFPNVFRIDSHGNVFSVNTQAKDKVAK